MSTVEHYDGNDGNDDTDDDDNDDNDDDNDDNDDDNILSLDKLCDLVLDGKYDELFNNVTSHHYDDDIMYNIMNYWSDELGVDDIIKCPYEFCKLLAKLVPVYPDVAIDNNTLLEVAMTCPQAIKDIVRYHPELRDGYIMESLRKLQRTCLTYAPGKGAR